MKKKTSMMEMPFGLIAGSLAIGNAFANRATQTEKGLVSEGAAS
jgi:hypothetical protein